jgi:uncharacterized protein YacL (UPF0231 family)
VLVFYIGCIHLIKGHWFDEEIGIQNQVISSVFEQPKTVSGYNPQRAFVFQDVRTASGCNF